MRITNLHISLKHKIDAIETRLDQFSKESNLRVDVCWDEIFNLWKVCFTSKRFPVGYIYHLNMEDLLNCDPDHIADAIIAEVKRSNIG